MFPNALRPSSHQKPIQVYVSQRPSALQPTKAHPGLRFPTPPPTFRLFVCVSYPVHPDVPHQPTQCHQPSFSCCLLREDMCPPVVFPACVAFRGSRVGFWCLRTDGFRRWHRLPLVSFLPHTHLRYTLRTPTEPHGPTTDNAQLWPFAARDKYPDLRHLAQRVPSSPRAVVHF